MSADVRQYRLGDVGEGAVVQVGEHLSAQYLVFPNVADLDIGALKAALMEGARVEPAGPGPAVRELPTPIEPGLRPVSGLLDRRHELDAAGATIEAGELVQFHAAGEGWGKTTLLRHLAYDHDAGSFGDGVVYVAVRRRPVEDLLQELFESFYETDGAYKPSAAALTRYLGGKRALILLDDVDFEPPDLEWLLDATRQCGYVLTAATSQAWSQGTTIPVQGLPSDDGLTLLSRRLGRELAGHERRLAGALCAALRGHPGRLRQAADVIRGGRPLTELVDTLQGAASPERALAALLVEPLAPTEQAVVGLCAAWGATPLADEHVRALVARPDVEAGVERLLKTGILETCSPRYRLAGALTEDLADLWDPTPWLERGLDYFAGWAEQHVTRPPRLVADADAILRVAEWGVEAGRWPQVLAVAQAMDPALALGLRWGAWGNVLRWGLAAAVNLRDGRAEAWALHQLGSRALCLGDVAAAGDQLSRALTLREAQGDQRGAATTRHNLDVLARRPPPGPPEPVGPSGLPPWGFLLLALAVLAVLGWGVMRLIDGLGGPTLEVDPPSLDLGAIALGTRAFQSVSVTNTGSGALSVDHPTASGDPAFDVAATTCVGPLEPGAACTVTVGFAPLTEGARNAELAIHHSGSGNPLPVALSGRGVVSDLSIEPPSVDFGAVAVSTSASRDLSVTNASAAPLTVDRVALGGDPAFEVAATTCAGPLEPGAACSVTIGFAPTADGRQSARASIHHSGAGGRLDVPVSGAGVGPDLTLWALRAAVADGTGRACDDCGVISSDPPGIDCPTDCAEDYPHGSRVTLTATAHQGWHFTGWERACSGTAATCTLEITDSVLSRAVFTPMSFPLAVEVVDDTGSPCDGCGTVASEPPGISCPTDCAGDYPGGSRVTLTATARQRWQFSGWEDACADFGEGQSCILDMTDSRLARAVFTPAISPQAVDLVVEVAAGSCSECFVTSDPPGISCPDDCTEGYAYGSTVTLTATSGEWEFSHWDGDCAAFGEARSCTLDMTDSRWAMAVFDPVLKVAVTDHNGNPCEGCGTVISDDDPPGISCPTDCDEGYTAGSTVTLTATAQGGWQFARWAGACSGTEPTCTVDMTGSRLVRAVFAPAPGPG